MESRTTTTIEEISTEINGAIVIESFEIATIETTPTPAKRVHHEQHHHKHRHHHRQHHDQRATTLTITDVSDGLDITETEQPETENHHHHHKDKQAEPQLSLPPPLPKSSPPYLTPSDEQDQFVWLTDLDASPQQPASLTEEPKPLAMQTPPTPRSSTGCQPLQTAAADTAVTSAAAAATVSQTAFSSETQLQQSAPAPPPTATTEQAVSLTDSDALPQQSASLATVKQLPQQAPAANNSSEWVVQSLTVAAAPTAAATAPSVRQTELIIETQPIKGAPLAQPMVLVGEVTADTIDTRRKSYRVSMDLTASPLQEPKKRCCCRIS
ncbi:protein hunchback [Drosophila novamexicana]|uniref:protein hunchback n=1 Tax=Drosophila novamexicana TaxID=47314 RepID=UPI0011E5A1F9|nr:protein hunchback [Drosophila novamexicana]